jgi:lycopene cyclase domain-containing protein
MGEYTAAALAAPVVVVALELAWLRTGLLREGRYWVTMAIVLAFMVPVDGALTRGPEPVVSYSDAATSGLRWPGSIPVEDFGFGFALTTAVLLAWRCQLRRRARSTTAVGAGAGRRG